MSDIYKLNEQKPNSNMANINDSEQNIEINSISEEIIDITNIMEKKMKDYQISQKTIDTILTEIENEQELKTYQSFDVRRSKNVISLENNNDFGMHLIFKKKVTINYLNYSKTDKSVTLVDNSVKSSFQIEETMKIYGINNLIYQNDKERSFPESKLELLKIVNNNVSNITFICPIETIKYTYNNFFLNEIPEKINLNSLSQYSNKYLKYSDNLIEYIETPERNKLISYLNDFIEMKVNIFKITGPSNNGKSLTLLLFSRLRKNIIYFNLKYIMFLYNSFNNDYLKVMIYELGRAFLSNEQIKNIEQIFKNFLYNEPWNLILKLFELLINENKIIIFDQFHEKTVNFKIYDQIEKEIKGKNLKLILCSSINDKMIKNEVLNTIRNFHGNPNNLNKDNQQFYFYFSNLLDKEKLKQLYEKKKETNEYFDYFDYNPKYIYKFINSKNESKTLDEIKSHIKKRMKKAYQEKNVLEEDILYSLGLNVGKELNYIDDFDILNYASLKYFTLELHEKYFKIHYSFKLIKNIIDEIKINNNIEDFFQKDKWKESNFYKLLRTHYFEESCILSLKKENILPNIFPSNNHYELNVKTIAELKEDEKYSHFNRVFFQEIKEELTLKEYYDMNIQTIEKIIKEYNLIEKKEEKDIWSHHYKSLNDKKKEYNDLLNKKRYKIVTKEGKEESVDIETKKIIIYKYKDSFYNGKILINQEEKTGKILDFGFLYGEKNKKIFIGFQMKMYSKDVKLNQDKKKNLNKIKIKENLNKLLAKTSIEYNMFIQEWHYFMVSFYDPETEYYNQDLIDICKAEGLEFIFYYPKHHYFYNRNFEKIDGTIQLTFNSNLDYNKENNPELIFENYNNINPNIYEYNTINFLKEKLCKNANEFIGKVKTGTEMKLKNLNGYIKHKLKEGKLLTFISIYNFSTNKPMPIPKNSYLLLFIHKENKDFIYYYNEKGEYYCGYVLQNQDEKIEPFFISSYINPDIQSFLVYKFN